MSTELIGIIITAVIAVVGGIWAILQVAYRLGKISEHINDFEQSTIEKLDAVNKRLDKIESTIEEHTSAFVQIYTFIGQKYPKKGQVFSQKFSPKTLNDLGKKIFEEIQGQEFLDYNKNYLFGFIDNEKPLTKLDVEQQAMQALLSLTNNAIFNRLKDWIYEASTIDLPDGSKYEIAIADVCYILSIPLRDMYISEHSMDHTVDKEGRTEEQFSPPLRASAGHNNINNDTDT